MRRDIVSIRDVIAANEMLRQRGSVLRVHMHDACGGQSFSLRGDAGEKGTDAERQAVLGFMRSLGHAMEFAEDGVNFWVVRA
ncbi:MAG: hypothetical protein ACI38Z_04965 [Parafannyhessea sp.]|uniref:RDAC family protein n=1 Tax=Parafannyhessea sp. TaxID=2847324 RepID=UPI003F10D352